MPVYWKWLYQPKRKDESEKDKILRKLSFKLPAVVRYNMVFALFIGVLAAFKTKTMWTCLYFYRYTPITMTALCYQQIYRYYRFVNGLPPPSTETQKQMTLADFIRSHQNKS